jgi:hypothetical protein
MASRAYAYQYTFLIITGRTSTTAQQKCERFWLITQKRMELTMVKRKKQKRAISPEALETLRRTAAHARQVRKEKIEARRLAGEANPYTKTVKLDEIRGADPAAVMRVVHMATSGRSVLYDAVNHPEHYKVGGIETIDFIEAKGLSYNLGNVVKYITRADYKGDKRQDLEKARWYLNREISGLP